MARIVTVYRSWHGYRRFRLAEMAHIRWIKISEALARCGHQVDIATVEPRWFFSLPPLRMGPNLRRVSLASVRWQDYDVVKTLFNTGFETLEHYGGGRHPFIISKLGSVVGQRDMEGIYFYGEQRKHLFSVQERIHRHSRFITLLSMPAQELWAECFGSDERLLLVPGAADRDIPPPGRDPYPVDGKLRCVFAGTVYGRKSQPEANAVLVEKLSRLGKQLRAANARLFMIGGGDIRRLDRTEVIHLGSVPYERAWDYLYHADIGVVVSAGRFMHNNESTKIYHYLRAGLPVVSESGFPNDYVVRESRCGTVVDCRGSGDLSEAVLAAGRTAWDKSYAVNYILANHTWDKRAAVYDLLLRRQFGNAHAEDARQIR